jgi:hypothetical protein
VVQYGTKPLPLVTIWQVKTRFRQHGIACRKFTRTQRLEMFHRHIVLVITGITKCHQGRGVADAGLQNFKTSDTCSRPCR